MGCLLVVIKNIHLKAVESPRPRPDLTGWVIRLVSFALVAT